MAALADVHAQRAAGVDAQGNHVPSAASAVLGREMGMDRVKYSPHPPFIALFIRKSWIYTRS
jgi:hypothetical protein